MISRGQPALATAGKAQVLSRPSVLARDGQLAEIVIPRLAKRTMPSSTLTPSPLRPPLDSWPSASAAFRDGQIVRLRAAKCTVGSGPQCTLRLRARGVGPLHCLIVRGPRRHRRSPLVGRYAAERPGVHRCRTGRRRPLEHRGHRTGGSGRRFGRPDRYAGGIGPVRRNVAAAMADRTGRIGASAQPAQRATGRTPSRVGRPPKNA